MQNMKYVCFTGHRRLEKFEKAKIALLLRKEIEEVLACGIRLFYTAEAGDFDNLVLDALNELRKDFSGINVVALHSIRKRQIESKADSIVKPPKFAETFRELIKNAHRLICFVSDTGGAFNLMLFAESKKVKVINIAEFDDFD